MQGLHASDAGVGRLASRAETVAAVGSPPRSSHMGAVESFAAPQLGAVLYLFGDCPTRAYCVRAPEQTVGPQRAPVPCSEPRRSPCRNSRGQSAGVLSSRRASH